MNTSVDTSGLHGCHILLVFSHLSISWRYFYKDVTDSRNLKSFIAGLCPGGPSIESKG